MHAGLTSMLESRIRRMSIDLENDYRTHLSDASFDVIGQGRVRSGKIFYGEVFVPQTQGRSSHMQWGLTEGHLHVQCISLWTGSLQTILRMRLQK